MLRTLPHGFDIEILGFVDDGAEKGSSRNDAPILGGIEYLESTGEDVSVVMGISAPATKEAIYARLKSNTRLSFPSIVHPQALLRDRTKMREGCVIAAGCHISIDISLGRFVFLNDSVNVGHDVTIGDFTSVMPLTAISGDVAIGSGCLIGTQSAIRQGLRIGDNAVVGMGSIVLRSVPPGATVIGNPARRIS